MPRADAQKLLSYIPRSAEICEFHTLSVMNIDSTNMTPQLMMKLAQAVCDNYDKYDGFVITHGTDTMAYSAAALSYMLKNINKPVIFTGSQLPIEAQGTDAIRNLSDAVYFACEDICGVYVVFNGILINGTHASKVKTRSFDAFKSVNYPDVAVIEDGTVKYNVCVSKADKEAFDPQVKLCTDVITVKMYPGIKESLFDFIKDNYRGVVIESFGLGGVPNDYNDILPRLHSLIDAGIAVAVTTQCVNEGIDLSVYEVGQSLAKENIIMCADMTYEAALMKLMRALAEFDNIKDIKNFMEKTYFNDKSY